MVGGNKRGNEQNSHQCNIDDVGKSIIDSVIGEQKRESQKKRAANPNQLLARTGRKVKNGCVAVVVACSYDADAACGNEQQVDDNRKPVYGTENILCVIVFLNHSK